MKSILKYLRNFEKRFKLTKNLDFFGRGKHATLSLVAPKRPWVPIIHLSLFSMRPVPPNLVDIIILS